MSIDHYHPSPRPVFGVQKPGRMYIPRPGVYAVILNSHMQVATIQVKDGFFLPGGGIQPDESIEDALQREAVEECGWSIKLGRLIGEAIDYIEVNENGPYYEIQSRFYRAELFEKLGDPQDPGHFLVWLPVQTAVTRLRRQSQAWVIRLILTNKEFI
jgi:8-oxo-dGTP diphosphatase